MAVHAVTIRITKVTEFTVVVEGTEEQACGLAFTFAKERGDQMDYKVQGEVVDLRPLPTDLEAKYMEAKKMMMEEVKAVEMTSLLNSTPERQVN
jgi:hypothetical protein